MVASSSKVYIANFAQCMVATHLHTLIYDSTPVKILEATNNNKPYLLDGYVTKKIIW